MHRAREELLAGARLAAQQHGGVGLRRLLDGLVDGLHRRRLADHLVEEVAHRLLGAILRAEQLGVERGGLQRLAGLRGDALELLLVVGVELPAAQPVEHLQHAEHRALRVDHRHREQRGGAVPGHLVDVGVEALLVSRRGDVHHAAVLRDVAGDALADLQADLFELGEVRGAAEDLLPREIDEVQRAAIGLHAVRDAIDELVEELVEVDLLADEAAHGQHHCGGIGRRPGHCGEERVQPPDAIGASQSVLGHHGHPREMRLFSRAGSLAMKKARASSAMSSTWPSAWPGSWWKRNSRFAPTDFAMRAASTLVE